MSGANVPAQLEHGLKVDFNVLAERKRNIKPRGIGISHQTTPPQHVSGYSQILGAQSSLDAPAAKKRAKGSSKLGKKPSAPPSQGGKRGGKQNQQAVAEQAG